MADVPVRYREEWECRLIPSSSLGMVFAVVVIPKRWVSAGLFSAESTGPGLYSAVRRSTLEREHRNRERGRPRRRPGSLYGETRSGVFVRRGPALPISEV